MFGQQNPTAPNPSGTEQPATEAQMIWRTVAQIEQNLQQVVNHVNNWVAKIQGIDAVAFAALMLHDGKEFKLDEEGVAKNQQAIQAVLAEMGRYREEAQKRVEAEAAAGATPAEAPTKPLRLVKPRQPKNGALFVPKKEKKDVQGSGPAKG
jgi:hypothetical protein